MSVPTISGLYRCDDRVVLVQPAHAPDAPRVIELRPCPQCDGLPARARRYHYHFGGGNRLGCICNGWGAVA